MEDVAVYGYVTPLKLKIVLTLGLTDSVVRDADVTMVRSHYTFSKDIAESFETSRYFAPCIWRTINLWRIHFCVLMLRMTPR